MILIKSPAKINLFLRILSRRRDGFHNLASLFARISLADSVTLKLLPRGIFCASSDPALPVDDKNLAVRAALLLQSKCKVSKGVDIYIDKNIPVGAGLGGGSSNAAAVLLGLNKLWKLKLSRRKLMKYGAMLGSDVPFFLMESPAAIATGRGEILTKLPYKAPRLWLVLVKPPFSISTKEAYARLKPRFYCKKGKEASLTPLMADARMLLQSVKQFDAKTLKYLLENTLELALNKEVIEINRIKKLLIDNGAFGSLMSGSGSAVFGIFQSKAKAAQAARSLGKNKGLRVFVVSTY